MANPFSFVARGLRALAGVVTAVFVGAVGYKAAKAPFEKNEQKPSNVIPMKRPNPRVVVAQRAPARRVNQSRGLERKFQR